MKCKKCGKVSGVDLSCPECRDRVNRHLKYITAEMDYKRERTIKKVNKLLKKANGGK